MKMSKRVRARLDRLITTTLDDRTDVDAVAAYAFVQTPRDAMKATLGIAGLGLLGGAVGALFDALLRRKRGTNGPDQSTSDSGIGRLSTSPSSLVAIVGDRFVAWSTDDNTLICDIPIDSIRSLATEQSKVSHTALVLVVADDTATAKLHGVYAHVNHLGWKLSFQTHLRLHHE